MSLYGKKKMKVRAYGWWTSYICMKQNLKTFCNHFKWGGVGLMGRDDEGNVYNVQYKTNWNCYYEFPLYNEYILIKIFI
jgi:hypothetical protein